MSSFAVCVIDQQRPWLTPSSTVAATIQFQSGRIPDHHRNRQCLRPSPRKSTPPCADAFETSAGRRSSSRLHRAERPPRRRRAAGTSRAPARTRFRQRRDPPCGSCRWRNPPASPGISWMRSRPELSGSSRTGPARGRPLLACHFGSGSSARVFPRGNQAYGPRSPGLRGTGLDQHCCSSQRSRRGAELLDCRSPSLMVRLARGAAAM